ncbi:MAG: alpha/beta fold hydrolase [Gammaproteobacteria bacterium]|nr:alpha/beta fold hydrolase [Gammaproteobacteria bacterium]
MSLRVILSSVTPRAGEPPLRDTGFGTPVLCLHCSAASASQWWSLCDQLRHRHRVMAPDLQGYGASPHWALGQRLTLMDEVRRIEPLLKAARGPVHLVGHSFGGAVAARFALAHPEMVRTLTLYEPVLFGLLCDDAGSATALREIQTLDLDVRRALRRGDAETAGEIFVDYWSGSSTWSALGEDKRASVREAMPKVCADFEAVFDDPLPAEAFAALGMPLLSLRGAAAPAPTRRVLERLARVNPAMSPQIIAGAGHMGPVTHAGPVNELIARFLAAHSGEPRGVSEDTAAREHAA